MCSECAPAAAWTRRHALLAGAAVSAGMLLSDPVAAGETLAVLPRNAWAGDDLPAGPIPEEPDVRVLVVHHTVNSNDYQPEEVRGLLRDIHAFHTGPGRGWPDIAYNFVVDRFGRAWETRAGSLDRPVAGDATGGSQGFDQKCAFLGDHRVDRPTTEAIDTMTTLLAFLADRSDVDTRPGAVVTFASRGSNLHPAGSAVETRTITGHRTMSRTACPGEAAFGLVEERFPADVTARRRTTATTAPSRAAPGPTSPPATSTPSTTSPGTGTAAAERTADGAPLPWPVVGSAGGLVAVVVGALLVVRGRTMHR